MVPAETVYSPDTQAGVAVAVVAGLRKDNAATARRSAGADCAGKVVSVYGARVDAPADRDIEQICDRADPDLK
jgi:hypothetical protein